VVEVRIADADPESSSVGKDDSAALVAEPTVASIGTDTPYHLETLPRDRSKPVADGRRVGSSTSGLDSRGI
jgi:hypothetical protein